MYLLKFIERGHKVMRGKSFRMDEDNANHIDCVERAVLRVLYAIQVRQSFV